MNMPGMIVSKDVLAVPVHSFMDVAALELHAALLMAQGKSADADAAFAKATDAETALGYREPPYYIRPVSETRGDALMRAQRYADAKKAYQAALVERPNSGFPLYGIAQADVAAGDKARPAPTSPRCSPRGRTPTPPCRRWPRPGPGPASMAKEPLLRANSKRR